MKVSVVIPTIQAESYIGPLLDCLVSQTVDPEIIVVDSSSHDSTAEIIRRYGNRVRFFQIPQESFDHGKTRDWALRQSSGEVVCFLSQDALPSGSRYLEKLLEPLREPNIAAAYCRQVPRPNASFPEKCIREFNYPAQGKSWGERDISRYGLKAFFFSNVCSAYKRAAYDAVGGFDYPILISEDMMIAAKLLHNGHDLAYTADATVYHSHDLTIHEEYERNARIGFVMEQYRDRLSGVDANDEGFAMLKHVSRELVRGGHVLSLFPFYAHVVAKYLGYKAGVRRYKKA